MARSSGGAAQPMPNWLFYPVATALAVIMLFPIFWTVTTSFKIAPDVMQGHLIPFVDFQPQWKGWQSLGLSPDTITGTSTVRDEFLKRFWNSVVASVAASSLALVIGSLAAYGLSRFSYRFLWMTNKDISFFFLSQMILPPVVLALPFLVLYKEIALLDTRIGLILLYNDPASTAYTATCKSDGSGCSCSSPSAGSQPATQAQYNVCVNNLLNGLIRFNVPTVKVTGCIPE